MVFWIANAFGLAAAYLLGSIPTGYLAGKLLKGIDIREHGSNSTGATNVLRNAGQIACCCGPCDRCAERCRGGRLRSLVLSLVVHHSADSSGPAYLGVLGCLSGWTCCIVGAWRFHWLNFTGGKSAGTGLGVLLAMSWHVGLGAAIVFGAALAIFLDNLCPSVRCWHWPQWLSSSVSNNRYPTD